MGRRLRAAVALLGTVALAAPLGGCSPAELAALDGEIGFFMSIFANPPKKGPGKSRPQKMSADLPVTLSGSIGGLSGTYDITIGSYGSFAGTADIKGSKRAKIRSEDDPAVMTLVENVAMDAFGIDIEVTESKVKFNGKQTTGGVKKKYNYKIKWEGVVASGEGAGNRVKGKLKSKDKFE